ncbi:septin 2 [Boothiomyces sp. JEL0866]|nr:septin 2 [Boothiomyces sp. JEL0866]
MIVKKKLMGYVGFHNLPNQYHRKSLKKGFQFTLMAVGEAGLGKSTLINTLFNTSIYPVKDVKELTNDTPKTAITYVTLDLEENGVKLKLTCIDTPGFGDFVNNEDSWRPILENIEARFDAYLEQENRVNRKNIVDTRVHACLYFIAPTGHSLKPIDIEFMKRLGGRVNLIPIIAKSDTLTDDEIKAFKARILEDFAFHQIPYYQPVSHDNDDPEIVQENKEVISKLPFAVVGSDREVTVGGKKVRGRQYPWGVIEVENEEHCDFVKLRHMLIRSHMEELKDHTNNVLYEKYRLQKLAENGGVTQEAERGANNISPLSKFEQERLAHDQKMAKMEAEMKAVFQQKVAEKETKLKQSEEELYARHREMKEQLERQRLDLEDKRKRLESGRGGNTKTKGKGLFK